MRFASAVLAGILLSIVIMITGVVLTNRWFPTGSFTSEQDVTNLVWAVRVQQYFIFPIMCIAVGGLTGFIAQTRRGLAAFAALFPALSFYLIAGGAGIQSLILVFLYVVLGCGTVAAMSFVLNRSDRRYNA
jgi:hypothetical protein